MIHFDTKTLASWKSRGITNISLEITDTGCAGHKLMIRENDLSGDTQMTIGMITLSYMKQYEDMFHDAYITWTGTKWICKSEVINTHCGCGSSFSLKTQNPLQDKIVMMKLAMKQRKDGIHKK